MKYLLAITLLVGLVVMLKIISSETQPLEPLTNKSPNTSSVICANIENKNLKKDNVQYYIEKYGRANQDEEQIRRVYDVFDKISRVADKRQHREPKLLVYNSQNFCLGEPLAAALPDGYIVLSKQAVEILYNNVSTIVGDTRAAFVLGHELAHLANDDHWHLEFYKIVRGNQSLRPLVNSFFEQNGEQKEIQADDRGFIFAAMAGFPVDKLLTNKPNFFDYWQQQTVSSFGKKNPELEIRAEAVRGRLGNLLQDLPYFHFGLRLSHFERCDDGVYFFKEFLKQFPAREVYNNLGVCYLQRARLKLGKNAYFYWLPSVLDVSTQIDDFRFQDSRGVGKALAEEFLREAKKFFELALQQEPSYLPAIVNLAITTLHLGEIYEARVAIEKAIEKAPDDLNIQGLQAIIMYEEGEKSPYVDMWTHSRQLLKNLTLKPKAPLSIFYNLAQLLELRKRADATELWQQLALDAANLPPPIRELVCEKSACPSISSKIPKNSWNLPVELGVSVEYDELASNTLSEWQKMPEKGHRLYEKKINETIYEHPNGSVSVLALDGTVEMVVLKKLEKMTLGELADYCGQPLSVRELVNGRVWTCDYWAALVVGEQVIEVWVVRAR